MFPSKIMCNTKNKFHSVYFHRYRITPEHFRNQTNTLTDIYRKHQEKYEVDNYDSPYFPSLSHEAADLRIGVASFCKAFPWHFVVDRNLEFVQLGVGFMRIFGHQLNKHGNDISTFFIFTRPRGVTLTFHEILKRSNTPFVLTLQKPEAADSFQAEVTYFKFTY
jgi:guanylate cyclase soluble subunit alpha